MTRRICFVVNNRANYARIKSVIQATTQIDSLEPVIIAGSSMLLDRFGSAVKTLENDGLPPDYLIHSSVEGNSPIAMAKSASLLVSDLATHFELIQPDAVVAVADRFETMATAIAASFLNIPLAHTQGGEVSGSIDESVRHAVTKLAHLHFPATKRAKDFVLRMGEQEDRVFLTGCPSIDLIGQTDLHFDDGFLDRIGGVGDDIDFSEPYVVAMLHPVTTEFNGGIQQSGEFVSAVSQLSSHGLQVVWMWPNIDSGSEFISSSMRRLREKEHPKSVRFFKNFAPEDYLRVINGASCIVGNSSSGIRESAYLGIPVVNVGNRQKNRERASNVVDVDMNAEAIELAVLDQIAKGRFEKSELFGDGRAGERIARILSEESLSIDKSLSYLKGS